MRSGYKVSALKHAILYLDREFAVTSAAFVPSCPVECGSCLCARISFRPDFFYPSTRLLFVCGM